MDTAIVIALIALTGSALSTAVSVFGAPAFQASRDARRTLETYREPLLAAAYELQARLHNILTNRFVETHILDGAAPKREAALESTLYVVAQYFGWREIIRREVQFLRFSHDDETRRISTLLLEISEVFLTDLYGPQCMIWRVEQRGLGERMIDSPAGRPLCLGYASFVEQRASMGRWLVPLEHDLGRLDAQGRERLTRLQHLLVDLVAQLDPERARYPFALEQA